MRPAAPALLVASALVCGLTQAGRAPSPAAPRAEPRSERFVVRFEDVLENRTRHVLRDVVATFPLPEDGPGQQVASLRLSPHAWTLSRAADGGWVGTVRVAYLAPGRAVRPGWIADVRFPSRPPSDASPRPGARLVADDPALTLDDPAVVAAAAEAWACRGAGGPRALAEAARDVVQAEVAYELDGAWRPAGDVLRDGRGSCTESTLAFVAVCRRLGVPARWAGGTVLRGTGERVLDRTFHRVGEAWIPPAGWVAFETTGDAWARPPRRMLVLARGGGADGPAGLYYHARNGWSAARGSGAAPTATKRATWVSEDAADAEGALADVAGWGPALAPGTVGAFRPVRPRPAPPAATSGAADAHPELPRVLAELLRESAARAELRGVVRLRLEGALRRAVVGAGTRRRARPESWWRALEARTVTGRSGRLRLAPRAYSSTCTNEPPVSSASSRR